MVRVAINGFGRIGRLVFRIGLKKGINFVAINDLTEPKNLAYLLKYDSVHGGYDGKVEAGKDFLKVDGKKIPIIAEKDPAQLPWKKYKVDVVVESTGRFTHKSDMMKHVEAGAKKVLLSAPPKDDVAVKVRGASLPRKSDKLVSNASCTTNSLVPMVMVLEKSFGIKSGFMSTIHAYTNDQRLLGLPHSDLRRGRAAAANIIPTSTGAAKAVTKVIPKLKGRLDGVAFRVPIPCGSITDFTCVVKKKGLTPEKINAAMKKASKTYLKGIMQYTEDPVVSSDIVDNSHSCIFDAGMTHVQGDLVKVCGWYDNEFGFSNRMVDTLKEMGKK